MERTANKHKRMEKEEASDSWRVGYEYENRNLPSSRQGRERENIMLFDKILQEK